MSVPNLAKLDLNLLVALEVLLQERSVTRAAIKLGMSQPSASTALARLRIHFGDQLLARRGNTYELTPLAVVLMGRTTDALDSVRRLLATDESFDPGELQREFTILGSDYSSATVGVAACERAAAVSPGTTLRFVNTAVEGLDEMVAVLERNDACIAPRGFVALPNITVTEDRWVCLVAEDHPLVHDHVSLQQLSELPWVLPYQTRRSPSPAVRQMQMLGVSFQVACFVDGFLTLPWYIRGTSRIALIPGHLAASLTLGTGLKTAPCPYEAPPIVGSLYWHPKFTHDAGHAWMRSLVAAAGLALHD